MIVCIAEGDAPDPAELTHWMAERMPYFMVPLGGSLAWPPPISSRQCYWTETWINA